MFIPWPDPVVVGANAGGAVNAANSGGAGGNVISDASGNDVGGNDASGNDADASRNDVAGASADNGAADVVDGSHGSPADVRLW